MIRALVLAFALAGFGCASAVKSLSSEEATIGCQAADVATTLFALTRSGVHEANPLLASALHAFGPVALVVVKLVLVATLLAEREEHPKVVAGANALACGAAAHNLILLK